MVRFLVATWRSWVQAVKITSQVAACIHLTFLRLHNVGSKYTGLAFLMKREKDISCYFMCDLVRVYGKEELLDIWTLTDDQRVTYKQKVPPTMLAAVSIVE